MNFGPATIVADSEARGDLRAFKTNHNEISCEAAFLWVLDSVGVVVFSLASFLMTVCDGCASGVSSEVWQLPLQLIQLQQQPLHKSRPTSITHLLHFVAFWVVMLYWLRF